MVYIDKLAEGSIAEIKSAISELAKLKGWNIKSAKGFISCLVVIVKHAENLGKIQGLTGAEKLAFVVAVILKLCPLPWWLPVSVVKPILEGAINAVVEALKGKF
jgi:hypothetical protein